MSAFIGTSTLGMASSEACQMQIGRQRIEAKYDDARHHTALKAPLDHIHARVSNRNDVSEIIKTSAKGTKERSLGDIGEEYDEVAGRDRQKHVRHYPRH